MKPGREIAYRIGIISLTFGFGLLYFIGQIRSVFGGDSGDLASAIMTGGIPHPPGYPLYTLLGIVILKAVKTGTVAWRIGFLSSIPAVLTLIFLYLLLYYLSRKAFQSFLAVSILGLLYPFWLYSEVIEVFQLNSLFTVLLFYSAFRFWKEGKGKYFLFFSYILGLSLTHHQIILFLMPALFYLIYKRKKDLVNKGIWVKSGLLFLAGLSFYFYPLVAAGQNPAVNWQGPPGFSNFIALVTRAGYGTFKVGSFVAHAPLLRLLDVWAFFDFVLKDFRILGLILSVAGFINLYRNFRTVFNAVLIAFISYIFFLFYASFPLSENFMVGTFERFVIPLYIILTFYVCFGLVTFGELFRKLAGKILTGKKGEQLAILMLSSFVIYPAGLFVLNYPKISVLKNDFTAENLGRDMLGTVPSDGILIISTDTPLFDTQYVYYSERKWPGVKLIHLSKLFLPYYGGQLKKYYPGLSVPAPGDDQQSLFRKFVSDNYGKFPIYSKLSFSIPTGVWLPEGLLFRYYKNGDVPDDRKAVSNTEKIWTAYQNPLSSDLFRYQNLLLSDVLNSYAVAHQESGYYEAKHGFNTEAEAHLLEAEKLNPGDLDSYTILAQAYMQEKKCAEAKAQINYRISKDPDSADSYFLMSLNYVLCDKDAGMAKKYEALYEQKRASQETPLKQL